MGDMPNKVRELRKKKGLTQAKLAEMARTSQQQIQRIESGVQATRYETASAICHALGCKVERAFPAAALILKSARRRKDTATQDEDLSRLSLAGIEMSGAEWSLKYMLRGGAKGILNVPVSEMDRIRSYILDTERSNFLVFDTWNCRVALNREHLLFSHLLFDPGQFRGHDLPEDDQSKLEFFIAGEKEPVCLQIDADEVRRGEDEVRHWSDYQMQQLFFEAEHDPDVFLVLDDDGEEAFFRAQDVAMVVCPLRLVEPDLKESEEEGYDEEGEDEVDDSQGEAIEPGSTVIPLTPRP